MGNQNVDRSALVDFTNGRKIYPEVAEYLGTRIKTERDYHDAITKADRDYQDADMALRRKAEDEGRQYDSYGADRDVQRAARRERDAAYEVATQARHEASRELLLNSPHKEVKWIAEHCLFANQGSEVEGYAVAILKILPATVEEIWTEAKDNRGMCDVFDRFFEEADKEGVFTDGNPMPGYRETAAYRNYIRRNWGNSYARDLQPHLDRIVKAINDHHREELAKAKAEWQGLDEARAENATRNRSAAQKAAWDTRRAAQEASTDPCADMAEDIRNGHNQEREMIDA